MTRIHVKHITVNFDAVTQAAKSRRLFGANLLTAGGVRTPIGVEDSLAPPDRSRALNDLSLLIHDGEAVSVIGPSGCGKTTLLKVIAGIIRPTAGEVRYDDRLLDEIPPIERGIGMVFQNYALMPQYTVRKNIGFFDILRHQPERVPERLHHIADTLQVEIRHLLNRRPPTLSGGEQQRVAIARCLARDPKLFLFDEPLSNVDAQYRARLRVQIKKLIQYYKITSVYVTHDQTEAKALGDRIAVLNQGTLAQIGTIRDLYETPTDTFVAGFFGTPAMNLFEGYIEGFTFEGKDFQLGPLNYEIKSRRKFWVGLHAEYIHVVHSGGIPAVVDYSEPLFSDLRQILRLKINSTLLTATVPLEPRIERNQTVQIQFEAKKAHVFDWNTGKRIQ